MPAVLHLQLPRSCDTVLHTWPCPVHQAHACHTPRGAGICACGQYRLCDPARLRCGDDCPCPCHTQETYAA